MRIAFASDRSGNFDIYTMSAQGTNVKRLTFDPAPERDPAWSPDGKRIAFTRKKGLTDFTGEIYVMNADGSNQRRLVQGGGAPKFSPDGKQIAYHALLGKGANVPLSLWVINVDGTGKRYITDQGGDPAWTPDGRSLVYGGITGPIVNVWKIAVAPGAKREHLYNDPIFACMPDVSPNGLQVAYVTAIIDSADLSQVATKLVVAKMGGSSGGRVTTSPHWEFAPSWSPDGTLIAVERDVDIDVHYATYAGGVGPGLGDSWIVLVRSDGEGEFEIPNHGYSDADPAFAPGST
jgi:Tol biopolymer transport system component